MIIDPNQVTKRTTTVYPSVFKPLLAGRIKQAVGDAAGLKNFGVNLVTLEPRSCSALRHWHTKQDEFIYLIEGEATLVTDSGEQILSAGMMAGFPAGVPNGHQLINKSLVTVVYLEIGDRTHEDQVYYPSNDLIAKLGADGKSIFMHKDGTLYEN